MWQENFKITKFPFVEIRQLYLISILIKTFGNTTALRYVFHLSQFLVLFCFSPLKTLVLKVLVCWDVIALQSFFHTGTVWLDC